MSHLSTLDSLPDHILKLIAIKLVWPTKEPHHTVKTGGEYVVDEMANYVHYQLLLPQIKDFCG